MSFGTTTRSLPKTKIAPALFAVPTEMGTVLRYDKSPVMLRSLVREVRTKEHTTVIGS